MSVAELLPTLKELNRSDKVRVMQFLVSELGGAEEALVVPGGEYPIWSPYDAYDAAEKMLAVLNAETDHA